MSSSCYECDRRASGFYWRSGSRSGQKGKSHARHLTAIHRGNGIVGRTGFCRHRVRRCARLGPAASSAWTRTGAQRVPTVSAVPAWAAGTATASGSGSSLALNRLPYPYLASTQGVRCAGRVAPLVATPVPPDAIRDGRVLARRAVKSDDEVRTCSTVGSLGVVCRTSRPHLLQDPPGGYRRWSGVEQADNAPSVGQPEIYRGHVGLDQAAALLCGGQPDLLSIELTVRGVRLETNDWCRLAGTYEVDMEMPGRRLAAAELGSRKVPCNRARGPSCRI